MVGLEGWRKLRRLVVDSARNPCGFKRDRVINSYRPFVSKLRSCPRVAPSVCFPHSKNHLSLQMGFTRNRIGVRRRKGQNPPCSTRAHLNEITVILPKTTTSSHDTSSSISIVVTAFYFFDRSSIRSRSSVNDVSSGTSRCSSILGCIRIRRHD